MKIVTIELIWSRLQAQFDQLEIPFFLYPWGGPKDISKVEDIP